MRFLAHVCFTLAIVCAFTFKAQIQIALYDRHTWDHSADIIVFLLGLGWLLWEASSRQKLINEELKKQQEIYENYKIYTSKRCIVTYAVYESAYKRDLYTGVTIAIGQLDIERDCFRVFISGDRAYQYTGQLEDLVSVWLSPTEENLASCHKKDVSLHMLNGMKPFQLDGTFLYFPDPIKGDHAYALSQGERRIIDGFAAEIRGVSLR